MSRDIHAEVTAALVAALEANPGDPLMPWHRGGANGAPINVASGEAYQGVNTLNLWVRGQLAGHAAAVWGTYRQWRAADCQVRRGETAVPVIFYKPIVRENGDGDEEAFRVLKWFPVFNADQVDGWTPPTPQGDPLPRLSAVDAVVAATGASIQEGGDQACYVLSTDSIRMPDGRRFFDTDSGSRTENFYAVLLHELTHWTGHGSRCDRDLGQRFGSQAYAMEELVAEIGAAFLCARLKITPAVREDHAQYLANWLQVLKADNKAIFTAAAKAQAAVDFTL
jgi:antirestriction protein ArdC